MKKKCGVIILPDNKMQEIDSVLNVLKKFKMKP